MIDRALHSVMRILYPVSSTQCFSSQGKRNGWHNCKNAMLNLQYSYMYVFKKHSNSLYISTETVLDLIFAYNFITLIIIRNNYQCYSGKRCGPWILFFFTFLVILQIFHCTCYPLYKDIRKNTAFWSEKQYFRTNKKKSYKKNNNNRVTKYIYTVDKNFFFKTYS